MHSAQTKINRIISELTLFQLNEGCTEIEMHLTKLPDGYQLNFESNIGSHGAEAAALLNKFLQVERNEAVENYYWELAGDDEGSDNSELQLIGQMIDIGEAKINHDKLYISAYKANR